MLKLYNSLSKKIENFEPINPSSVGMYSCGSTVYDKTHLGHARTFLIFDILYRVLVYIYGKEHVRYVRNITDVDDKINKRATELNITIQELTAQNIKEMNEDLDYLGLLKPNFEPKATEHISEIIEIIKKLLENGNAYVSNGHVLFDTSSCPNYGILSGRNTEEMIAGARIEIAPYKKNPTDFVLWKPSLDIDDESSKFESPWSIGRPGWHIECSAMSNKYLGVDFDIHCGGNDLKFPHHENEIAQSTCAFPGSSYAKYWVHTGFLMINGEKMSKSLKNFITIDDLRKQNIKGSTIRYAFLKSHYRAPFDFSMKLIREAEKNLKDLHKAVENVDASGEINNEVMASLFDDLNTSKLLAELHKLKTSNPSELKKAMQFLGIFDETFYSQNNFSLSISEDEIIKLIDERTNAKANKNYSKADEIRNILLSKGILIEDTKDGTIWKIADK